VHCTNGLGLCDSHDEQRSSSRRAAHAHSLARAGASDLKGSPAAPRVLRGRHVGARRTPCFRRPARVLCRTRLETNVLQMCWAGAANVLRTSDRRNPAKPSETTDADPSARFALVRLRFADNSLYRGARIRTGPLSRYSDSGRPLWSGQASKHERTVGRCRGRAPHPGPDTGYQALEHASSARRASRERTNHQAVLCDRDSNPPRTPAFRVDLRRRGVVGDRAS
jgi:hypothetical protein